MLYNRDVIELDLKEFLKKMRRKENSVSLIHSSHIIYIRIIFLEILINLIKVLITVL